MAAPSDSRVCISGSGVGVGVGVGVAVGVGVSVGGNVAVGSGVGVLVCVAVAVGVGVAAIWASGPQAATRIIKTTAITDAYLLSITRPPKWLAIP
jgi:hypothetical protein